MQTTNRRLSVQLSVLLATVCTVFLLIGGAADAGGPPAPTVEYVVDSGDTLWGIAAEHLPSGSDVRPFIRAIKDATGITASNLQPGQVLLIPLP
ncbi:MAG TPA: LysM peptidoglycan-binding domain-containing protein [Acidimicrobiia bacterium]|nr:LysM peptidoglycan-binding domain-containing protein [Acidimicrobiia bacterium]